MNQTTNSSTNFPANWTREKVFVHTDSGLCVSVSTSSSRSRRSYSCQIGRMLEEGAVDSRGVPSGRISPHFPIRRNLSLVSSIEFSHDYETIIGQLLAQASAWIQSQMDAELQQELENKRFREHAQLSRFSPKTRVTGKTEKNRSAK